ncbi:MAG TPA: hypothetical protein VGK67_13075 [Myxococcales bacterium]
MRALSAIAPLLGVLLSAAAAQAAVQGSLTASLGPGLDTNPSRTVANDASTLDGYLGLAATGKLKLTFGEGQQATGRYDVGLRKFFLTNREDLAVQQAALDWAMSLGRVVVGAEASGKWWASVSGSRDYADLGGDLFLDVALARQVSLRVLAGAHGFVYPPAHLGPPDPAAPPVDPKTADADGAYDWVGPQGSLALRWQPARRHTATLALFGALPYYNGFSRYEGSSEFANGADGYPVVRRRDAQFGGQVSYGYRGPVAVQAGYSYVRINSTSYGEASERHRLWAAASAKLPLRLYASLLAAYQFIGYPDGVFLSWDLQLLDDESQSSVGAKLGFAVTDEIDLEARYASYWFELPKVAAPSDPSATLPTTWWRHTAFLGVTLRL